nr:MAG TPA: hypothetical protein [Caudoviricetes sp.]
MGIVQRVFAQIQDSIIKNVIVADDYELANMLARMTYGNDAIAVEITDIPARIGDKYYEGNFWRVNEDKTETRIEAKPSAEAELEALRAQVLYMSMLQEVNVHE